MFPKEDNMENWNQLKDHSYNLIYKRQFLYWAFLAISAVLILFSLVLWIKSPLMDAKAIETWQNASCLHWLLAHLADIMRYVLPDFFNGFITFVVIQYPVCLVVLGIIIWFFKCQRKKLVNGQDAARRAMRKLVIKKWKQLKEEDQIRG